MEESSRGERRRHGERERERWKEREICWFESLCPLLPEATFNASIFSYSVSQFSGTLDNGDIFRCHNQHQVGGSKGCW